MLNGVGKEFLTDQDETLPLVVLQGREKGGEETRRLGVLKVEVVASEVEGVTIPVKTLGHAPRPRLSLQDCSSPGQLGDGETCQARPQDQQFIGGTVHLDGWSGVCGGVS